MRCQCRSRLAGLCPQTSEELTIPLAVFLYPDQQLTGISVLSVKPRGRGKVLAGVHRTPPLQAGQDMHISCNSSMTKAMRVYVGSVTSLGVNDITSCCSMMREMRVI